MSSLPPQGMQDQEQPGDTEGGADQEANEVTVCVTLNTQTGQFTVGLQPPDNPDGSEETEESEDDGMKPAKDIDDALRTAKTLLESGGKADTPDQGQEAFVSGYQDQASPDMLTSRGM